MSIRKFVALGLTLSLLLTLAGSAGADSSPSVSARSQQVGPRMATVVTVDLTNPFIELDVVMSGDRIGGDEAFSAMINRTGPVAAINANFFDAYTTLEPLNSIMQQGRLLYMEGTTASMLFGGSSNKVQFDRFSTVLKGYLNGQRSNAWNNQTQSMDFYLFDVWYVNRLPSDPSGVYLFTPERGRELMLEGGTVVEVVGNRVSGVSYHAAQAVIPGDGYLIYYGSQSADRAYIEARFQTGRTVAFEYETKVPAGTSQPINLRDFTGMISAGPLLIKQGQIVANAADEGFVEEKITTNRAQRSAVGVTAANQLLLVTLPNATILELAETMKQLGAAHALGLDGGASSGLYANGQTLTTPGRKLSTVLAVYDRREAWAAQVRGTRARSLEEARQMGRQWLAYTVTQFKDVAHDDWHADSFSRLVALGILGGYGDGLIKPLAEIQVDAFIKMTVSALGHPMANGKGYWAQPFIDKALALGLVKPGEFDRYDRPINRGEMARLVARAANSEAVSQEALTRARSSIADYSSLPADVRADVLLAYSLGIVGGFPDGTFQAEQNANRAAAAVMIIRLLDADARLKLP